MNAAATTRLHPALAWGLGATALASAWALWWPQQEQGAADTATLSPLAAANPGSRPWPAASSAGAPATPLAPPAARESSEPPLLSPASRDPFNPAPPPPPPTAAKPATEPAHADVASSPPPPPPPPMTHRVIGRFVSPDGQTLLFVQDGAQAVLAAPGQALSSGYVVESITAQELRLRHPQVDQAVSLPLPEENVR